MERNIVLAEGKVVKKGGRKKPPRYEDIIKRPVEGRNQSEVPVPAESRSQEKVKGPVSVRRPAAAAASGLSAIFTNLTVNIQEEWVPPPTVPINPPNHPEHASSTPLETQINLTGSDNPVRRWPRPIDHKCLPWLYDMPSPVCYYMHSQSPQYFLEISVDLGFSRTDGRDRRGPKIPLDVGFRGTTVDYERNILYLTTGKEGTIIQYQLSDIDSEPELLNEQMVTGARELAGIHYSSKTGHLAVADPERSRITLESSIGTRLGLISRIEDGKQIFARPMGIVWGPDGETSVIITDEGDSLIDSSVACVQLHPPALKWRRVMNIPYNIWCEDGLVFVGSSKAERHIDVMSAENGTLLGTVSDCPGHPTGIRRDTDGNIVVISYV